MNDTLAITVPIIGPYASVNSVGGNSHRAGKKSDAYKRLYADVLEAAKDEITRTGWATADSDCFAAIVRYVTDRRRHDAMNLGKCEFDALTQAGVWKDDNLANPCLPFIRFDDVGGHRVSIVVVKLHKPARGVEHREPVAKPRQLSDGGKRAVVRRAAQEDSWKPGDPIPYGYALLNGRLVTRESALQKMGR